MPISTMEKDFNMNKMARYFIEYDFMWSEDINKIKFSDNSCVFFFF